jgi:hypothetical protein
MPISLSSSFLATKPKRPNWTFKELANQTEENSKREKLAAEIFLGQAGAPFAPVENWDSFPGLLPPRHGHRERPTCGLGAPWECPGTQAVSLRSWVVAVRNAGCSQRLQLFAGISRLCPRLGRRRDPPCPPCRRREAGSPKEWTAPLK